MPTISECVEQTAIELVHRHSLDEIEESLRATGVAADLASRLVLLVPSAFAAARFEPEGIEFPTDFLVGPEAALRHLPYQDEPGYVEARALAEKWLAEGRLSLVERVLDWSAEANAIKDAKSQGLTPARMVSVHHGDRW
jgi:hypothetical protein